MVKEGGGSPSKPWGWAFRIPASISRLGPSRLREAPFPPRTSAHLPLQHAFSMGGGCRGPSKAPQALTHRKLFRVCFGKCPKELALRESQGGLPHPPPTTHHHPPYLTPPDLVPPAIREPGPQAQ